jgi:selenide,water dikinase
MNDIKLTGYSKGSGCGCKISPAALKEILQTSDDFPADNRIWVGNDTHDDAAVFGWNEQEGLISTTDFFMPMVDDAYSFGKIAAANAMSDVYAMGGTPMMALAILGWPIDKLPLSLAREVMEGARYTCRMAGITIAGGHSIESPEPFFGLSVNGRVPKNNLKQNNTAQQGDLLYLTKPIGNGIVSAAVKRGQLEDDSHLESIISYMSTLNKLGATVSHVEGVHAMTDVTGFGLAGHLLEICESSNLGAEIEFNQIPVYPFLHSYISKHIYPDMTMKNYSHYSSKISSLDLAKLLVMCDPQTSGGLLIAVAPHAAHELEAYMNDFGIMGHSQPIGTLVKSTNPIIQVR